jgi:1-acyl-sn-glycerol-3-phosphate acyltransferase
MIRGVLYWLLGAIITFLWGLVAFSGYFLSRRGHDFLVKNIKLWSRFLLRFFYGVRLEIEGLDFIERDRAYIIVSNHRSYTDILVGNSFSPVEFRWLAKKSLFRLPMIGLAMKLAGYIPIVREHARSASRSLDRTAEVLKEGVSVWIFPEGTRTPEERLRRFKRGAFELARTTGTPLLPVVMVNTDRIFTHPLVIRPQRVQVVVLKPVRYSDFEKRGAREREAVARLMEAVRDAMQRTYDARAART